MNEERLQSAETQSDLELDQIIEIRDSEIDVEEIMDRVRANVARRRAEGAYREDLDAIAREVFAQIGLAGPDSESTREEGLALTLSELDSRWLIREQPFVSHVPVLGRLVVAVRNLWNWMSAKWYVQAILQQQVNFNALVVRALHEMAIEHELVVEGVRQLEDLYERQREEMASLKEEIERQQSPDLQPNDSEDGETH